MTDLVPGRECGGCTVCCTALLVDTPEIQKAPGVTCKYCKNGCTIYETRYPVCRDFHCAWRKLDILDDSWRPDRSQVFTQFERDNIPPSFGTDFGIGLLLIGDPGWTVRQDWFQHVVASGVMSDIPMFLCLPGRRGNEAARILLNTDAMRTAIQDGAMTPLLERAVTRLKAHDVRQAPMVHSGNDVGA